MIESFRHKGLEQLWTGERDDTADAARAWCTAKEARILARLDIAREPAQMDLPGWSLSSLKGAWEGAWSVWITGNAWITFRFKTSKARHSASLDTAQNVADVDLVDILKPKRRLRHAHEGPAVPRRHGAA